jgi:rRNA-processing protein Efg1
MAPIQKAIRDLERCIKKKVGKGESTEALDKKLALLYDDKTISDQIQKEKRNSAKYHMIKFVERQKLVRKIRSLDQQIAAAQDIADNTALNASILRSSSTSLSSLKLKEILLVRMRNSD